MKRSCFLLSLLILANFSCRKTMEGEPGGSTEPSDGRPNIIFLLADDMRYDAGGYTGNPLAITPNLDALAAAGTNFKNTYATSSICTISRASIFSGQYERRHGINSFDKNFTASALQQTYPVLLRKNGYYTGFIGKYGVGTQLPASSFDYWKGFPGHGVYFYKDSATGQPVHETEFKEEQAEQFMATRDKSKPFCLSISFKAPHSEDGVTENNGFRPDPYFNNWFTSVQFPLPATYSNQFYNKFPALWRTSQQGVVNEARVRWNLRFSTVEKFQTTSRAIYRLVSGIDKAIGELRSYLNANGLDRNTIIVFMSDNGYYMGEHGLEGKWYGHEESIRVPLIIYDPRQQQRQTASEIALNVDIAPTILKWAGVTIPGSMQGTPLQPLLTGTPLAWRTEFFYEHPYDAGAGVYLPKTIGIVPPPLKYMGYYNGLNPFSQTLYEELFDDSADPTEATNLARQSNQQSRLQAFRKKVTDYERNLK